MSTRTGMSKLIVEHVATAGTGRSAARAARGWRLVESALAGYPSPAAIAAAGRSALPADQDEILTALLRRVTGGGDDWAALTVLAVVAPRIGWVVSRWAAAGVSADDLADLEAQLVAECWTVIVAVGGGDHDPPPRPGLKLVDRAWGRVRDRRSRERARTPIPLADPTDHAWGSTAGDTRSGLELLSAAVAAAVGDGQLPVGAARAIWLTRVAGLTSAETATALDVTAGSVRVLRARAAHRLAG